MKNFLRVRAFKSKRGLEAWESKYLDANPDVRQFRFRPIIHFVIFGLREGRRASTPSINLPRAGYNREGLLGFSDSKHTFLLVAHENRTEFFGGEHSFLSMVRAFSSLGNVIVVVPSGNQKYIESILGFCSKVVEMPVSWWVDSDSSSLAMSTVVLVNEAPDLVVVNTSTPKSFMQASKLSGVPLIVALREAIGADESLAKIYGQDSEQVIQFLKNHASIVVANSEYTSGLLGKHGIRTRTVRNLVTESGPEHRGILAGRPTVGIVSSNIPKKGILDFVRSAVILQSMRPDVAFKLIGPRTKHAKIAIRMAKNLGVSDIELTGFKSNKDEIYASLDILVNTSKFPETFGLTVAEAISRGIPVVAYNRGALKEIIAQDIDGSLVEPDDVHEIATNCHLWLEKLGKEKKERSESKNHKNWLTDPERYLEDWRRVTKELFAETEEIQSPGDTNLKLSVIVPLYNGEQFVERRLNSILNQSRVVDEIIVIDDASSDSCISIAERVLEKSGIDYKIHRMESNQGVFSSWVKGIELSASKLIWIAEQDDFCSSEFVKQCLPYFENPEISLVYCASNTVDPSGEIISLRNQAHYRNVSPQIWSRDHLLSGFSYLQFWKYGYNPIPNASAVILDKSFIDLDRVRQCKFTGDMVAYITASRHQKIQYVSKVLNSFTRSSTGVTRQHMNSLAFRNEINKVIEIASQFDSISPKALIFTSNPNSIDGGSERIWWEAKKSLGMNDYQILYSCASPNLSKLNEIDKKVEFLRYEKALDSRIKAMNMNPAFAIINQGHLFEGTEVMNALKNRRIPFAVVNQLVKPESSYKLLTVGQKQKTGELLQSAEFVSFTSLSNKLMAEDQVGCEFDNALIHRNPVEDFSHKEMPRFQDLEHHVAVPSRVLFEHKGQDLIIEALNNISLKSSGIKLHFFGGGKDLFESISRVSNMNLSEHFQFHPRVDDLSTIWETCGAFIMPSRMEGMPLVALSGASAGLIPIVSDAGGLRDFQAKIRSIPIRRITAEGVVESLEKYMSMSIQQKKSLSALIRSDFQSFTAGKENWVDPYEIASSFIR